MKQLIQMKLKELEILIMVSIGLLICAFPIKSHATYCSYVYLSSQSQIDQFPQNYSCDSVGTLSVSPNSNFSLDSLYQLRFISYLDIYSINYELDDFKGLQNLDSVGKIGISTRLPNSFAEFPTCPVNELVLNQATVSDLTGLGSIIYLEKLRISNVNTLKTLSGIQNLSSLNELNVQNCDSLLQIEFPGLNSSMDAIFLNNCRAWDGTLNLGSCDSIKTSLSILQCDFSNLTVNGLEYLDLLSVRFCDSVNSLNGLPDLEYLGKLSVHSCAAFSSVLFPSLTQIDWIDFNGLTSFTNLNGLGSVTSIDQLSLTNLTNQSQFQVTQNIKTVNTLDLAAGYSPSNDDSISYNFPHLEHCSSFSVNDIWGMIKSIHIKTWADSSFVGIWISAPQLTGITFDQDPKVVSAQTISFSSSKMDFGFVTDHLQSANQLYIVQNDWTNWRFNNLEWVDILWVSDNPLLTTCCRLYEQISSGKIQQYTISNNGSSCNFVYNMYQNCGAPANADEDGVLDIDDNCIDVANPNQSDVDSDGIGDVCDNCPSVANPGQTDTNGNGVGNACENSNYDVQLAVDNGDVAVSSSSGLILKGVDGNCYRILVGGEGELLTRLVPCP